VLDQSHFLRAILEAPDDDGPRLVYADWLEERGEEARAEFIRVQVELARTPDRINEPIELAADRLRGSEFGDLLSAAIGTEFIPAGFTVARPNPHYAALHRRERNLLGVNWVSWAAELAGGIFRPVLLNESGWIQGECARVADDDETFVLDCLFRRGFVEMAVCRWGAWLALADILAATAPIRTVKLTTWPIIEVCAGPCAHGRVAPSRDLRLFTGRLRQDGAAELEVLTAEWPGIRFTLPEYGRAWPAISVPAAVRLEAGEPVGLNAAGQAVPFTWTHGE